MTGTTVPCEAIHVFNCYTECSAQRCAICNAAAKRDLDLFHDNTAKRALSIAADYMVTRDR